MIVDPVAVPWGRSDFVERSAMAFASTYLYSGIGRSASYLVYAIRWSNMKAARFRIRNRLNSVLVKSVIGEPLGEMPFWLCLDHFQNCRQSGHNSGFEKPTAFLVISDRRNARDPDRIGGHGLTWHSRSPKLHWDLQFSSAIKSEMYSARHLLSGSQSQTDVYRLQHDDQRSHFHHDEM
jgi:hypothetical protein